MQMKIRIGSRLTAGWRCLFPFAPLRLCANKKERKCDEHGSGPSLLPSLVFGLLLFTSGCQSPRQVWDSLKGEGFPEWSGQMAGGVRGKSSEAQPSGFFTDRRSEQIEQNLGGGF
jgi:hypothetical protein